jgi:virginiamycin B lyase
MRAFYDNTAIEGQIRRRRRWLSLLALLPGVLLSLSILVSACGSQGNGTGAVATQVPPLLQGQVHLVPAPRVTSQVRTAQEHVYTVSTSNVGLMQLAVDGQDNVWVGEMNTNQLDRLNARTGAVTRWTPPGGQYGLMTTLVDAQGHVWFAEQNANYIGRFDPGRQSFRLFPLGMLAGSPLGPQDLRFDSQGRLWFTAATGNAIGRLDPASGAIRLWPIPSSPFSIAVAPGGRIWFGATGLIGFIDPLTNQTSLYPLPDAQTQVFSMAADTTGRLWFTEVLPGKLGMFDPATGNLTELAIPTMAGNPPALYELVVDHHNSVWFVNVGINTLVQYRPEQQTLTFFRLSRRDTPPNPPYGLTLDPAGNLWFTFGGSPANYIGEMTP